VEESQGDEAAGQPSADGSGHGIARAGGLLLVGMMRRLLVRSHLEVAGYCAKLAGRVVALLDSGL
jgi:hypothetical protein